MSEGRLAIGAVFAEKYRVIREIGRGGMGAVYEVEHVHSKGRAALKVMREDRDDPSLSKRMLAEARALAKLSHPNVVRLIDVGIIHANDVGPRASEPPSTEGVFYLVEEFVEGSTLRDALDERLILEARELLELIVPIVDALEYAHGEGVVHRDIKPENIVIAAGARGQRPQPKLIDFGIALVATEDRATRANSVLGTPRYMAPEQAWGRDDIDGRADLWAVGALAFECLAGAPPYEGPNDRAILAEIVSRDPPPLGEAAQSIDEELADVLSLSLVRSRDDRVQSAAAWKHALLSLRGPIANEPWYRRLVATYGALDAPSREAPPADPVVAKLAVEPDPRPLERAEPRTPTSDSTRLERERITRPVPYRALGLIVAIVAGVTVVRAATSGASEARRPVAEPPPTPIRMASPPERVASNEPRAPLVEDASARAAPTVEPTATTHVTSTTRRTIPRARVSTSSGADSGAARPSVLMGANRAPIVDESE